MLILAIHMFGPVLLSVASVQTFTMLHRSTWLVYMSFDLWRPIRNESLLWGHLIGGWRFYVTSSALFLTPQSPHHRAATVCIAHTCRAVAAQPHSLKWVTFSRQHCTPNMAGCISLAILCSKALHITLPSGQKQSIQHILEASDWPDTAFHLKLKFHFWVDWFSHSRLRCLRFILTGVHIVWP